MPMIIDTSATPVFGTGALSRSGDIGRLQMVQQVRVRSSNHIILENDSGRNTQIVRNLDVICFT